MFHEVQKVEGRDLVILKDTHKNNHSNWKLSTRPFRWYGCWYLKIAKSHSSLFQLPKTGIGLPKERVDFYCYKSDYVVDPDLNSSLSGNPLIIKDFAKYLRKVFHLGHVRYVGHAEIATHIGPINLRYRKLNVL